MSDELRMKVSDAYSFDFTPVVGGKVFKSQVDFDAVERAFIEDGYVKIPKVVAELGQKLVVYATPDQLVCRHDGNSYSKLMTGQEWYDSFISELNREGTLVVAGITLVEAAAKRAAGFEGGE